MDDNNFQNYNENRNSVDRSRPMGLLLCYLLFIYLQLDLNDTKAAIIQNQAVVAEYGNYRYTIVIKDNNGWNWLRYRFRKDTNYFWGQIYTNVELVCRDFISTVENHTNWIFNFYLSCLWEAFLAQHNLFELLFYIYCLLYLSDIWLVWCYAVCCCWLCYLGCSGCVLVCVESRRVKTPQLVIEV